MRTDQRAVVAFDPGQVTGFAVWGEDGLSYSTQGPMRQVLREWVPWLKRALPPFILIEGVFVGKGPHASLEVAGAASFIEGSLWTAGVLHDAEVWKPKPNSWRAKLGFPGSRVDGTGKKRRSKRPDYEEDARCFAQVHAGKRFEEETTHEAEAIAMAAVAWERFVERSAA